MTPEQLLAAFGRMLTVRRFEETVWDLYRRGEMPGLAHLSIGQEAVAVGVCFALEDDDYIVSTHRGHGHCIAKGTSPKALMAEMLGKSDGICRGRGGTMHFADIEHHNVGAMGIVGAGVGLGGGLALACAMHESGQIAAAFCGDGAINEGVMYETLNLAAIWRLPLIVVCENNQYGEYTAARAVTAGGRLSARAEAMGVATAEVDGMDVADVYRATAAAAAHARSGEGPVFLECETYRFSGHHVGDLERYRTKDEVEFWRQRDPIENAAEQLRALGVADSELENADAAALARVAEAVEFARASAFPEPSELMDYVYVR
jgi:TPP-dependent pyruvate/acetoin dehydrogenase alpha subunit